MKTKYKNIYLADDDPDEWDLFLFAMEEFLRDATITCFKDGKDLLDKLIVPGTAIPDLIFLDVNMPLIGGLEALSQIRSSEGLPYIPVVMYSTSNLTELVDKALHLGANYYLKKPDSLMELKIMLRRIMSGDTPMDGGHRN